ncbi:MFS transporter [Streptomyces sp. NPDC006739]|uniref:MFS transporter n=1 Tax=Streptomyces sp. NPDC006739 TaxID=3364763 RepID=UPI0036924163
MTSVTALPSSPGRLPALCRRGAFPLYASVLVALLAASSAPPPLYALHQAAWHFSAMTLTVVFSTYALSLLLVLLTAGTLSDHLGRGPVLAGALLAEAVAMAVFATAQGVPGLIAARILQGLATSAAGAALLDFPRRPGRATAANGITLVTGMALGVLAATALVQYAPARTVYLLLLLLFTAQAAAPLLAPETAHPHPGARRSLRPAVTVAPASRPALALATPGIVAAWALGGFYSSLGPSLARLIAPHAARATGGLLFFTMTAAAGLAARALPAREPRRCRAADPGSPADPERPPSAQPALAVRRRRGGGRGLRRRHPGSSAPAAAPGRPGRTRRHARRHYVLSYLAMSIPAVLAGLLTHVYGLQTAVSLYAVTVVLLALTGLTRAVRRPRTT